MGYIFHGGCIGCDNELSVCPSCMYMEPNWNLPTMNPREIELEKERKAMKKEAYRAQKLNPINLASEIKNIFRRGIR